MQGMPSGSTRLGGCGITMPPEQPMPGEAFLELEQGLPEFLDGLEGLQPQQLFLQSADEPLGHTVTLRRPDEARAGSMPETEAPSGRQVVSVKLCKFLPGMREDFIRLPPGGARGAALSRDSC